MRRIVIVLRATGGELFLRATTNPQPRHSPTPSISISPEEVHLDLRLKTLNSKERPSTTKVARSLRNLSRSTKKFIEEFGRLMEFSNSPMPGSRVMIIERFLSFVLSLHTNLCLHSDRNLPI